VDGSFCLCLHNRVHVGVNEQRKPSLLQADITTSCFSAYDVETTCLTVDLRRTDKSKVFRSCDMGMRGKM